MKLMKLTEFQKELFVPGSAPDIRTLKSDIDNGDLPGVAMGSKYFVDVDALTGPVADLVSKVLNNGAFEKVTRKRISH